ncbi:MAG: gliding motility-associated C-terminal domain-containing protein [Sphingobacteriales bacterium]|nr:gliding motility-associated C-terminal domain-containing protein [Sphingobacteriales bacterium]
MAPRHFLILFLFVLGYSSLSAQQGGHTGRPNNFCGVTASFSPGNDSVLTLAQQYDLFTFVNTSSNATDYQFWVDHFSIQMNTPLNFSFNPGLTEIKLVAYNGDCTDTAICYYFQPGEFPPDTNNLKMYYGKPQSTEYIRGFARTENGGFLYAATREQSGYMNQPQRGYLFKTRATGCVEWSFIVDSTNRMNFISTLDKIAVIPGGGGYYAAGSTESNTHFIAKFTTNGSISWVKKMQVPPLNNLPAVFQIHSIEAMPDGGVLLLGNTFYKNLFLCRLGANGAPLWQRELNAGDEMYLGGMQNMLVKDGAIYINGFMSYRYGVDYTYMSLVMKLDYNDGQVIWMNRYRETGGDITMGNMIAEDSTILIATICSPVQAGTYTTGSILRLDTTGAIRSVTSVNGSLKYYAMKPVLRRVSGKHYYLLSAGFQPLDLQPYISHQTKLAKLDSNFNVVWSKHHAAIQLGQYTYMEPDSDESLVMAGNENGNVLEYYHSFSPKIVVRKLDSSGTEALTNCLLGNQSMTRENFTGLLQEPVTGLAPSTPAYPFTDLYLAGRTYYPEMRYKCPDYVDSCSFIKVTGPASVCNISNAYTYKVHRNRACGQPVEWQISAGVTILNQTDTSVIVRFPDFGNYSIAGALNFSCFPVKDSLPVIAASISPLLELGPDTSICPDNTIQLHAGHRYLSYQWNTGSTDSLISVSSPGKYWVDITDSCGNLMTDTINVMPAAVLPISIGPDRSKCNSDTLRLNAPPGFLNYAWSPAYNISSVTAQQVAVNPSVDTSYYIKAEKTPGCFAYDTVRITVHTSPPISLGADKSICSGDSLLLDAGPGFSQYNWNTGAQTQVVKIQTAGQFDVTGITVQGCRSADTFRLINVYALPIVSLDPDTTLCTGSSRMLDAGSGYARYTWNNGSTAQTLTVTGTGLYAVLVTDNNGCNGRDTTRISGILPLPSGFLFTDTAICSYGSLQLIAVPSFTAYHWSTGSRAAFVSISQPGIYWLDATDKNNCTGRDSVIVSLKECMKGLYVPTAFTPNNDGKNDVLRPFLFGNVKKYDFRVFNRWGEIEFQTKDLSTGWNGTCNGLLQDGNVYAWICRYQLEGGEEKMEKGTVLLIR